MLLEPETENEKAARHSRDWEAIKQADREGRDRSTVLVEVNYEPSLITGRCRCKACKAARESQSEESKVQKES